MMQRIRDLIEQDRLEDAIAMFRERWRISGNVLQARLNFLERERSVGVIDSTEYQTFRVRLGRDLLMELNEREREDRS